VTVQPIHSRLEQATPPDTPNIYFCRHVDGRSKQTTKTKQTVMNTLEIKGDWNITKGKLKEKWAKLTDNDLQYVEGKQDELVGRIQKSTGATREAVEKVIKESSAACNCN
jgi:uncharacterized protein YjbJ (UPF0337 family)